MMEAIVNYNNGAARQVAAEFMHEFLSMLGRIDLDEIERVFQILRSARNQGAMIYVAGNGGSASTASHWANDLGKATKAAHRSPMRVISLTDNVSWLTALANDEGFERALAGQLENFAQSGDVLAVISASGNSLNLIRAVELARERGLVTVGLLGFDGGVLKSMVDATLLLPTAKGAYGLVESGQGLICHILAACLAADGIEALDGRARHNGRGELSRAQH
jgi:D-sedoheptulose 7-phosphate isomerase